MSSSSSSSSSAPASSITQNPPAQNSSGGPETIDDTDPRIIYFSSNNHTTWSSENNQRDGVYNHTLHVTKSNTDFATLLFNGTSISLTSLLSPNGSNFTALLDGVPSGPFSLALPGNGQDISTPTIVFSVSNLPLAPHNLTLSKAKNESDSAEFNIDSFAVIGWSDPAMSTLPHSSISGRTMGASSTTSSGTTPVGTDSSSPVQTFTKVLAIGAIVGGVLGGVALLTVVILAFYFIRRGKRRRYRY